MGIIDKLGGKSKGFDQAIAEAEGRAQDESQNSGQPSQNDGGQQNQADNPQQQNVRAQNEGEESGQPAQEKKQEQSQQQQSRDRKLAGKFESREDLIKGLNELGQKLDLGRIKTDRAQELSNEELEQEYKVLEQKLGKTSDTDKLRQENQKLKQQLQQQSQEMRQIKGYLARLTKQQRQNSAAQSQQPAAQAQNPQQSGQPDSGDQQASGPKTSRFSKFSPQNRGAGQPDQSQQNNQQAQQQSDGAGQQASADFDNDEWYRKFTSNPKEALDEYFEMKQEEQEQVRQNLNQQQQKKVQQAAQQYQGNQQGQQTLDNQQYEQRRKQALSKQIQQFRQQHDVDQEIEKEMAKVMNANPHLKMGNIFPNGENLQIAYNVAQRNLGRQEENPQSPGVEGRNVNNTNQNIEAQKATAQISSSNRRNVPRHQDEDERFAQELKEDLFSKNKKGLFG